MNNYKVGDKLILHSSNGNNYDITIVNINHFRELPYAIDMYCNGIYYGDLQFCDEEFLNQCEKQSEAEEG